MSVYGFFDFGEDEKSVENFTRQVTGNQLTLDIRKHILSRTNDIGGIEIDGVVLMSREDINAARDHWNGYAVFIFIMFTLFALAVATSVKFKKPPKRKSKTKKNTGAQSGGPR